MGPPNIWIDVPKWPEGLAHSSLRVGIRLKRFSGHRGHARFHVFVDVAVEHPHTNIVRNHVCGNELRWQQRKDVRAVTFDRNHISVPVRCMDIDFAPQGHHIPPYVLSALHQGRARVKAAGR